MVTFINTYKQPIMVNSHTCHTFMRNRSTIPGRPRVFGVFSWLELAEIVHLGVIWVREFSGHIYKHRQTTDYGKQARATKGDQPYMGFLGQGIQWSHL